jgi:cyclopropane fatty-acyl-phospholipid synthase-like methyltransferase
MSKPEFIARQGRRPTGLLGRLVARIMAKETRPENERTLGFLNLTEQDQVFEIGFGHGETLNRIARQVPKGRMGGIDFSQVMVSHARRRNRKWIDQGRMDLRLGDSAEIPDDVGHFTKVFSVHTIYFWQRPADHLSQAFRILHPRGRLVLGYRSTADEKAVRSFPDPVYRFPGVADVEDHLRVIGFENVGTNTAFVGERLMHWTVAEKPAPPGIPTDR